jgi:hypothetical protein
VLRIMSKDACFIERIMLFEAYTYLTKHGLMQDFHSCHGESACSRLLTSNRSFAFPGYFDYICAKRDLASLVARQPCAWKTPLWPMTSCSA